MKRFIFVVILLSANITHADTEASLGSQSIFTDFLSESTGVFTEIGLIISTNKFVYPKEGAIELAKVSEAINHCISESEPYFQKFIIQLQWSNPDLEILRVKHVFRLGGHNITIDQQDPHSIVAGGHIYGLTSTIEYINQSNAVESIELATTTPPGPALFSYISYKIAKKDLNTCQWLVRDVTSSLYHRVSDLEPFVE